MLRGQLEGAELVGHPPIEFGNGHVLADVDLAVRALLAESPRRLQGAL